MGGGVDIDNIENYIASLESKLDLYKEKNILDRNYKFYLTSTITPLNNEYQNYGIMAAIDHINVLKDIFKNYPKFKALPKIYEGRSYGGYLALMCAKIAPWYVDGVIENSGEAMLLLEYIIGKELNIPEASYEYKNFKVGVFLKTHWNADKNSLKCFKDENYLIRALLNKEHLILQAQKNKNILYTSYHSSIDQLTPVKYKISMIDILKALNYDVDFHLIEEKDIDGKFIKNLEHGCGISDKMLLQKELPKMLEKLKNKTFEIKENSISYPCKNKVFTFKDKNDKFMLEII
ncbi:DUF2920 family protein [Campylobacter peloridis]|uniref:DUF2920 family protein n=1 Tax=Campylobacter peloridis TaxID=488546 RepID=UPI0028FCC0EB|nr:DUF2920 family protein [Campylobacter peloridis]